MPIFESLSQYNASLISSCGNFSYDTATIHLYLNNINQTLTNLQCFDMCRSQAVLYVHQGYMGLILMYVVFTFLVMLLMTLQPRYHRLMIYAFSAVMLAITLVMFL